VIHHVRAVVIQAEPRRLDLATGWNQVIELIVVGAGCGGADLVTFPETFLPGSLWGLAGLSGLRHAVRRSVQGELHDP
jgi:predicted amidohydrolase